MVTLRFETLSLKTLKLSLPFEQKLSYGIFRF